MKLAVMQPYFFPYIGYFQLINAVDVFVFYDDVDYIKNGWINRNRILMNGKSHYVTVPCIKASSNKLINTIQYDSTSKDYKKIMKTITQAYNKAPYFENIFPMIQRIFSTSTDQISVLAQQSIIDVCTYLGLQTKFKISSIDYPDTKELGKADRLIEICKNEGSNYYLNPIDGKKLYDKEIFQKHNIHLSFLESEGVTYKQYSKEFIPRLSIIDILMFNSVDEILELLRYYNLN